VPAITYQVQIGFSNALQGVIVFQQSGFFNVNGTVQTIDVFGSPYTTFFDGAQDDITSDVESIRIRRGRDDILGQMNAGTCELVVRRPTDRAYWNPANKASPLNASNAPGFVPGRPVRIRATDPTTSTVYGLFLGFLRSASFDYQTGQCRLACIDLFYYLQRTSPLDPVLATTEGGTGSESFTPDDTAALSADQSVTTDVSGRGFVRTLIS